MPWPLIVAFGLAGAILLVLAMPVRVTVSVTGEGERRVRTRVHALLGLVDRELITRPPKRESTPKRGRFSWAPLGSEGFMRCLGRFLKRLFHALHTGELIGFARIGLDDPADTGELWAIMGPVSVLLTQRYPHFELAPSFAGARFDFEGRWSVAVVPLELIAVTLAFVLSPPALRAAAAAWRMR